MALPLRQGKLEKESLTPADFELMPEFDQGYELLDGRLVQKPMAGDRHERIIRRISKAYDRFDPDDTIGTLWSSSATFDVGTGWMPLPDIGFMLASRVPPESDKSIKGVPDWVVEVQSPSDLTSKTEREKAAAKIQRWLSVGVRLVWSVNPGLKVVEVYRPGPNQAKAVKVLAMGEVLDGEEVVPGFSLPVAVLFG